MAYAKHHNPTYDMWKNYPDETTPVMAETMNGYDNIISDIEDELVKLKTVATSGNYNDLENRLIPDGTTITKDADGKIHAVGGSGGTTDYNGLSNKPSINGVTLSGNKTTSDLGISIPTKVSQLQNDSGYLTQHQSLDGYATQTWVSNQGYTSESWVLEQGYTTEEWVQNQGYATQIWANNTFPTKSNMNGALSYKADASFISSTSALNAYNSVGMFWGLSGNTISDKPSGVDDFALLVEKIGDNILQTLTTSTTTYKRIATSTSTSYEWSDWSEIDYVLPDGTYDDMTVGKANVADKVPTTVTTDDTVYVTGSTSNTNVSETSMKKLKYARFTDSPGTSSEEGITRATFGNSTASGSEGNSTGITRLYGDSTRYVDLYPVSGLTANRIIRLPNKAGTLSIDGTSSRHAKENIHPISDAEAHKILDLEIVEFDYKELFGGEKNQVGVIAEDAVKIIPSPVVIPNGYDEETYDENTEDTSTVPYVQYAKYVPYLIRMIQLQEQRIAELERKVLE